MKFSSFIIKLALSLVLVSSCSSDTDDGQSDAAEWTNLLEADSLAQWRSLQKDTLPMGWTLDSGILSFKKVPKAPKADLITKAHYFDFELKFEFKLQTASNSGVKYRTAGSLGMEYQIIDDVDGKDIKKPERRLASLYDLVTASDTKVAAPIGEWNRARIVAHGDKVEHWLNGQKVMSIERHSDEWAKHFQRSKYKDKVGFAESAGPILLQDHNDEVSYRSLLVKKL